jgi:hypothetical protein
MLARDGDPRQQNQEAGDEHELAEPIVNVAEHQAEDQNGQLAKADCHCLSHRMQVGGIDILRNGSDQDGTQAAQEQRRESRDRSRAFASLVREAELAEDQHRPHDYRQAGDDNRNIHHDMQGRAAAGI